MDSKDKPSSCCKEKSNKPLLETENKEVINIPPDGGIYAWIVCVCCFLVNGIIFGIINTFGILFMKLKKDLEANGVEDAATKCALVGSLTVGTTFFLSFLVGIIADKIGLRITSMIGGVIATLGMGLSCFFYTNINILYLTYGLMFGAGSSMVYTPSLTILGHYFRRRLGIVNGVVTAGSSIFTIGMSFINQYILEHHGLLSCLQLFTCLSALLILCGITFIPVLAPNKPPTSKPTGSKFRQLLEKVIYLKNWQNKRFVVWTLAVPLALFGYFVPYVHLPQLAKNVPLHPDEMINEEMASKLIMCIGVSSGLGRIASGYIADIPAIKRNGNRLVLQQASFISIGICTMLLSAAQSFGDSVFEVLMAFSFIMGIFDGCFITMLGPIAFDICGPQGASQAIGFLLALCSIPLTAGPPIAGYIYDKTGNYTAAFLGAGIPPIVGALAMFAMRCIPAETSDEEAENQSKLLPQSKTQTSLADKV